MPWKCQVRIFFFTGGGGGGGGGRWGRVGADEEGGEADIG